MGRTPSATLQRIGDGSGARFSHAIGVIDVGSNTSRLVVFDASSSCAIRPIFETKEVPRLGAGLPPDGRLTSEASARGVAAMERFARTLEYLGVSKTLAVTTSAVRDAPNAGEFIAAVQRATGILLRVLSGSEEARYGYLGVASAWELADDLICDLGGGSLQLVHTRKGEVANSVSLPLGVLRVTQRHIGHDPPKGREVEELREYVRDTIQTTIEAFGGAHRRLFAIGGTVRSAARAAIALRDYPVRRVHGFPIRAHDLDALMDLMVEMPSPKRRAIPGIGSDRSDVIVAGLVVLEEVLRASGAPEIVVTGTGIRDGLALEMIGAHLPASAIELASRSVTAASERFSFSLARGRAVADLAGQLFDLLAEGQNWGPSERLALTTAAWMHDAGTSIDLWRHAYHSAYLIQNYPIYGLEQHETLLAASIVAQHAGDDLPSGWRRGLAPVLRPSDASTARRLGAVLQICGLLAVAEPRFSLAPGGRTLGVTFSTPTSTTLPPRTVEKARKPIEREFDVEVRIKDG
ncbi:MAG: Ppx/GppA phosphatase family protein [Thermoplasmata archaeon]